MVDELRGGLMADRISEDKIEEYWWLPSRGGGMAISELVASPTVFMHLPINFVA